MTQAEQAAEKIRYDMYRSDKRTGNDELIAIIQQAIDDEAAELKKQLDMAGDFVIQLTADNKDKDQQIYELREVLSGVRYYLTTLEHKENCRLGMSNHPEMEPDECSCGLDYNKFEVAQALSKNKIKDIFEIIDQEIREIEECQ